MPRKRRSDPGGRKPRVSSDRLNHHNNNNVVNHHDEASLDGGLGGVLDDLEDCGSPMSGGAGGQPVQRNAANARERARMRVLSRAFCRLKTTLPWVPADTKLSKLDTLRLATSYIAHLRDVLLLPAGEAAGRLQHVPRTPPCAPGRPHPLNLTWPFTFQQPGPEPWISRGGACSTARSPRDSNGTANPSSGSSVSSSSADGDEDLVGEDEDPTPAAASRLSGGRLLEQTNFLQDGYLARFDVDVHLHNGDLLDVGYS